MAPPSRDHECGPCLPVDANVSESSGWHCQGKCSRELSQRDEAEPSEFQCSICLEDHAVDGCCTLPCQHRFCFQSLQCYFQGIVQDRRLNNLVCPVEGCGFDLRAAEHTHILQECLPEESYYRLLSLLACELSCICPCGSPGCAEFVFVDDQDDPTNLCCPLDHRFCRYCEGGPHPGLSCEEQRRRLDLKRSHEEREKERREQKAVWKSALAMGWKPCPLQCAFGGGYKAAAECDHVTCHCGFEFCWDCGVARSVLLAHDNRWHKPSCRYHTNPADVTDEAERSDACPECAKLPVGMVCSYPCDDGYPTAVLSRLQGKCARKPAKAPKKAPGYATIAEKSAARVAAYMKSSLYELVL